MAYKQPYNSPNLRIDGEDNELSLSKSTERKINKRIKRDNKTMKVRVKPGKEGELSDYAMKHVTKTNKRGKVTIEVPKSEMNSSKSKLFDTSIQKWTSNPYGESPSQQPTAKGFKKQRNKDRVAKTAAGVLTGIVGVGGGVVASLQNKHVNI